MLIQRLWLSMKYGSISLPSAANPIITTGGMVGDRKLEYFSTMGEIARKATADFIPIVAPGNIQNVLTAMKDAGLAFPVVVKPDLGWCGYGVRLLKNEEQLQKYLDLFPVSETLILQRYISDEGEAGLFYARGPTEKTGKTISLLLRQFPYVIGDGHNTVGMLMKADLRLKRLINDSFHECSFDADYVPSAGEKVRLALIGSTRVGGLYIDGSKNITPALSHRLDMIAQDMNTFHVGRFDVRYSSIAALEAGEFTIMEVNGAGSEAVHAWDPKYTIREAFSIVFAKQRLLFGLGDACRSAGHKPCGLIKLAKLHFHQQALMRCYPPSN